MNPNSVYDVNLPDTVSTQGYLVNRGIEIYHDFLVKLKRSTTRDPEKVEISKLRNTLLREVESGLQMVQPVPLSVSGTLFPCALIRPGWWEKPGGPKISNIKFPDPLQDWLYHGFDLWGPSWDYSWMLDTDDNKIRIDRPYFIAQLGGGDEADSLPVFIPFSIARKLRQEFQEGWGGFEATVTGVLGHRSHFGELGRQYEHVGGLLDFCLVLREDETTHKVTRSPEDTRLYSGYLWKCLAPRKWVGDIHKVKLNQVFFLFEHVNFAESEAVKFGLDSLDFKENRIRGKHGDLITVQKVSSLVPGDCEWSPQDVYNLLIKKIV